MYGASLLLERWEFQRPQIRLCGSRSHAQTYASPNLFPILAGMRHCCPVSRLLFNLVIDRIIRDIYGRDRHHNILAYTDDLTPIAAIPAAF